MTFQYKLMFHASLSAPGHENFWQRFSKAYKVPRIGLTRVLDDVRIQTQGPLQMPLAGNQVLSFLVRTPSEGGGIDKLF